MTEQGFVNRTRLAWMRTAVTFVAAGLLSARMLFIDAVSGVVWLAVALLLLLLTLTAAFGYRVRNQGEGPSADHILLAQCLGLVAVAGLALGGMLFD